MKKIISFIAGLLLVGLLTGCSSNTSQSDDPKTKSGTEYFEDRVSDWNTRKLAYSYSKNEVTKIVTREVMDYYHNQYSDKDEARADKQNYINRQREDGILVEGVTINIDYFDDVMVVTWTEDMSKVDKDDYSGSSAWDEESNSLQFDILKDEMVNSDGYIEIDKSKFNSNALSVEG